MNRLQLLLFLTIALSVFALFHYFVFARVVGGLDLRGPWRVALIWALAIAANSVAAGEILRRTSWGGPLFTVSGTWLGILAIAVAVFVIEWVLSLAWPEWRFRFTVGALALVAGVAAYAFVNGTRPPVLTDVRVALQRLPADASGFTIVQLSDLHLERHASASRLCALVDRVNALSPDLVVITGDLVDDDIPEGTGLGACLARIEARHGALAVPGNHDYYAGYSAFLRFARCANVTVLRNEHRLIGGVLNVAGIDEPDGRRFGEGGPDLGRALDGRRPDVPTVLLSHRPEVFARAAARGVDLQLSGHTHAGQIPPLDLLVWLFYPYSYGYAERGAARIYTSCGTGTWGPRMRLFSRNEIVRITLGPQR